MDNLYASIMGVDYENAVFEKGLFIAKEIGLSEEYFQTFADSFNEKFQEALSRYLTNVRSRLCADGSPWPYVQGYIKSAAEGYLEGYTEGYIEGHLETLKDTVKNAMESFHLSMEDAMNGLKVTQEEQAILRKML